MPLKKVIDYGDLIDFGYFVFSLFPALGANSQAAEQEHHHNA